LQVSFRSLSAKKPSIIGLFCGKKTIKIRHLEPFHLNYVAMGGRIQDGEDA